MKIPVLLTISLSFLLGACSVRKSYKAVVDKKQFQIGHQDSIKSEILGEWRKVWIYTPERIEAAASYPTIYILDGDYNFHSFSGLVNHLIYTKQIPKMFIVAISNTNRFRDFTPSKMDTDFWNGDPLEENGGGELFLDFIEKELKPYMEKNYPVNNYQMLVGHSLGGLLAIHALVNRPELFTSYIAIDPSMWWDYHRLLKQADTVLMNSRYKNKSLFVGMANDQNTGSELDVLLSDTTKGNSHAQSVFRFVQQTQPKNALNFEWKFYSGQDHNGSILISEYDALQFFFSWYLWKEPKDFYKKEDSKENAAELVSVLKNYASNASNRMGYELLPDVFTLDGIGQNFMYYNKPITALHFFEYNKEIHPDGGQVYESLGDYQLHVNKDTASARSYYARAIELGDKTSETKMKTLLKQ